MAIKKQQNQQIWRTQSQDTSKFETVFCWVSTGWQPLAVPSIQIKVPSKPFVYGTSAGLKTNNKNEVIRAIQKGFPISSFEHLQKEMAIPAATLSKIVNITQRTLTRRKKEGRLQPDESDRVLRLSSLFDKAQQAFKDKAIAQQWFKTQKKALGGQSPLEYATTEPGVREVEDLLGRIEHGVFS